jgi:hypothetical protein
MKLPESSLTPRDQSCLGPRQLKVPGSVEWCYQTLEVFKARWARKEMIESQWHQALDELTEYKVWEHVPPDQPYGSLDKMLKAELGVNSRTALTQLRVQAAAKNTDGTVIPKHSNQHNVDAQIGHPQSIRALQSGVCRTTQQTLDRLAREFPELHQRVIDGELRVWTAARQAGIHRITPKPKTAAKNILKDFSPEEIQELLKNLNNAGSPGS